MSEIKVASRYAKSLLDLAIEKNALEEIKNDMASFVKVLTTNTELATVVNNPIIPLDKKNSILAAIFGSNVNEITSTFFKLVINKGRSNTLLLTAKEFLNQYNIYKNIVSAKVVSASELTEEAKAEIVNLVKSATGGDVILHASVDESLIGGFILTVGDKQIDTSLLTKLGRVKQQFSQKVVA